MRSPSKSFSGGRRSGKSNSASLSRSRGSTKSSRSRTPSPSYQRHARPQRRPRSRSASPSYRRRYSPRRQRDANEDPSNVFVGNLHREVDEGLLRDHFSSYGKVIDVKVRQLQFYAEGWPSSGGPLALVLSSNTLAGAGALPACLVE